MGIFNKSFKNFIFLTLIIFSIVSISLAWTEGQHLDIHVVPFTLFRSIPNEIENERILNNAITLISQNSNIKRKLILPEVYNFKQWWNKYSSQTTISTNVKRLIKEGQIEFVNGGMTMTDEGMINYNEFMEQMADGIKFIFKTFNVKPKNAFNINSYGHSEGIAYILSTMGIENVVVNKISREIKNQMSSNKHLEFIWKESHHRHMNSSFNLFTHVTPNDRIGITESCGPNQEVCRQFALLNKSIEDYDEPELKKMALVLLDQYRAKALQFRTNQVLIPFGDVGFFDDVEYASKLLPFYEALFDEINSNQKLKTKIQWSTLNDYFKGVHNTQYPIGLAPVKTFGDAEISNQNDEQIPPGSPIIPDSREFNIYRGDLFSYGNIEEQYFTSHFSSISDIRMLVKNTTNILKTVESYHSMIQNNIGDRVSDINSFEQCKNSLYLFQRDSSMIGMASNDHYQSISESLRKCQTELSNSLSKLTNIAFECKEPIEIVLDGEVSNSSPKPLIEIPEKGEQTLVFYNPLETKRQEVYKLIVSTPNVMVKNNIGSPILAQLNPVWSDDTENSIVPEANKYELSFFVETDPLGASTYKLVYADAPDTTIPATSTVLSTSYLSLETSDFEPFVINQARIGSQELYLENSVYRLRLRHTTGSLERLFIKGTKEIEELPLASQNMVYHHSNNNADLPILPAGDIQSIKIPTVLMRMIKGPISQEIISYKNSSMSPFRKQHIQLFNCMDALKHECTDVSKTILFSTTVDHSAHQHDPIVRFSINPSTSSDLNKKSVYYTDLNSISLVQRKISQFQSYNTRFYPINSVAYIGETNSVSGLKLGIFTRLPLGVAGVNEGILDVMIRSHRMTNNNRGSTTIPLWLSISQAKEMPSPPFPFQLVRSIQSPMIASSMTSGECSGRFNPRIVSPPSVQLISFGPMEDDVVYMRYLNTERSRTVGIEMSKLFPSFDSHHVFSSDIAFTKFQDANNVSVALPPGRLTTLISKLRYYPDRSREMESDPVPKSFTHQFQDKVGEMKPQTLAKDQQNVFVPDNVPPKFNSPYGAPKSKLVGGDSVIVDNHNQPNEMIPVIESGTEKKELRIQDQIAHNNKKKAEQALEGGARSTNKNTGPYRRDQKKDSLKEYLKQQQPQGFNALKQNTAFSQGIAGGGPLNRDAIKEIFKAHLNPDVNIQHQEINEDIERQKEKDLLAIQKQIQERKRLEKERQKEKELKEKELLDNNNNIINNITNNINNITTENNSLNNNITINNYNNTQIKDEQNIIENNNNNNILMDKLTEKLNELKSKSPFDLMENQNNNINNNIISNNNNLNSKTSLELQQTMQELNQIKTSFLMLQQENTAQKNTMDQLKSINTMLLDQLKDFKKIQEDLREQYQSKVEETKTQATQELEVILKKERIEHDTKIKEIKEELHHYYRKQIDEKQMELTNLEKQHQETKELGHQAAQENLFNMVRVKELENAMKPTPNILQRLLEKLPAMLQNNIDEENTKPKKPLTPLERILNSIESDIHMRIRVSKSEIQKIMKKPPNPIKIITKELNIKRLTEQLELIANARKQIEENPELGNKPLEEITDGEILLGLKQQKGYALAKEKTEPSSDYFYVILSIGLVLMVVYVFWVYSRRRQHKDYKSPLHVGVSSSNGVKSTLSYFSGISHQENKVE